HARLRNVIERIFGVIKRRFKVLVIAQEYSFAMQSKLISGLAMLHNFIRVYDPGDILDDPEEETTQDDHDRSLNRDRAVGPEERDRAAKHRDKIAQDMWADYERRGRQRRV
ncbi:hypothetical protein EDB84DRAFT_1261993, partial [Lactarius hengduanensis]